VHFPDWLFQNLDDSGIVRSRASASVARRRAARPLQWALDMSGGEKRRVLIVDDEEELAWSLSKRLERARPRLEVQTANDGSTALKMLAANRVDLLVADVRMPGMSGIDLVMAALGANGGLPVIVMTAFKTADLDDLTSRSSIKFLEKPFAFEEFLRRVDESLVDARKGFSGAISVQTLPDIVQLYVLSNTTGILTIRHESGEGAVWFEHGVIPHAVTDQHRGEEAFFEIMGWSGGEFSMQVGVTAPERSVTSTWQELLMESCRRTDELRRESKSPPQEVTGWTLFPPAETTLEETTTGPAMGAGQGRHEEATSPRENDMNIKDSLAKLNQIDGFIGAALVDAESGMLLGQEGGGSMNLEVAAAGNTEVVKAKRKTMSNLGLKENIEDILITLQKQYHMIRPLRARTTLFFYVALDRSRANLAMARIALADVEKDLVV
jgi:CheY-like chemotaxis protein